jgi:chemotaxis family two-component system response regulator Rcp1
MTDRPFEILLVDDSPTDRLLATEALSLASFENHLSWVEDGVQALEYLRHEKGYSNSIRPDLILLDLQMPRMNGWEFLAVFKADPDLRQIPVVVLTTSEAEQDIAICYANHANCYITKPVTFPGLVEVLQHVESFWFDVARLPAMKLPRSLELENGEN